MKRILLTLIIFLFSNFSFGQRDFEYRDLSITDKKLSQLRLQKYSSAIKGFFQSKGYASLSSKNLPEMFFANYFFDKGEELIGVRLNISSPKRIHNKVLAFQDAFLYHSSKIGGVAIYLKVKTRKKALRLARNFINKMEKKSYSYSKILPEFNLISSVHAGEATCHKDLSSPEIDLKEHVHTANGASSVVYLSIAKDCFMNALKGAWSSTGGVVASAWRFFNNPVKSAKKAWNTGVKMVKGTKRFLANLKTHMSSLGSLFSTLSGETIAQVLCSIIGGIGGVALVAMLINPAIGLAKVIAKLASKVKHLLKIKNLIELTSRLKGVSVGLGVKSSAVISNLIINTGHKFQTTVKKLHELGENKLMLRYAQCGI